MKNITMLRRTIFFHVDEDEDYVDMHLDQLAEDKQIMEKARRKAEELDLGEQNEFEYTYFRN